MMLQTWERHEDTKFSPLTWSQPRTQGASEDVWVKGFFKVKFSIPRLAEGRSECSRTGCIVFSSAPAPTSPIRIGGQRKAPWRSTINLGVGLLETPSISEGISSS